MRERFAVFRAQNPEVSAKNNSEVYWSWIGQMEDDGMEPGTIEQYCQYVNAPWEVKKAAEKAHANAVTRHAPDMSDDDLVKIVKNCQKPSLQATLFLMLNTGCHAQDAKRLRRSQVEWYNDPDGRACIQVSWFWTKSIQKRKDRLGAVKYPFVMPPPRTFTASI